MCVLVVLYGNISLGRYFPGIAAPVLFFTVMKLSPEISLVVLRWGLCLLLMIHGIARIVLDMVQPFGDFLGAQGLGAGLLIAWTLTLIEIAGGLALALGIARRLLASYFALQLAAGIVLVHAEHGWFVVGAGRNGMEYSVFLILALILVAFSEPKS